MAVYGSGVHNEETDNLKIQLYLGDSVFSKRELCFVSRYNYNGISYQDGWASSTNDLDFPFPLDIKLKVGVSSSYFKSLDINKEIGEFFTKQAILAGKIIDHQSFISSPAWYMLAPLLIHKQFRETYGVDMHITENMEKIIRKNIFETYCPLNKSILRSLYSYEKTGVTFCNIVDCSDDHFYDFKNPGVLVNETRHKLASEYAATWGIPHAHDSQSVN